eukprot:s936_g23.t1
MRRSWGEHRGEKGGQKGDHKGGKRAGQKGDHKGNHKGGKKGGYQSPDDLMSCTCLFLESNKYFLEDVFGATEPVQQLRYLLGLATAAGRQTEALQVPVNGELCRAAGEATEEATQRWSENDLLRAMVPRSERYPLKLKVLLLVEGAENSLGSLEVFQNLLRLRFCHGPISVFNVDLPRSVQSHGLTAHSHQDILKAYATFVRADRERLSMQPADTWHIHVAGESHFLRCAVTCPVFYSRRGGEGDLYILTVWDSEHRLGPEVKFSGGDICHQRDRNLVAAARREFLEELQPFGISESDLAEPFDDRVFIYYGDLNVRNTARYTVTPYIFIKVKADFFERTRVEGYSKQVNAEASHFVTENSSPEVRRQYHLGEHALPWLEHTHWSWVRSSISSEGKPNEVQYIDELHDHPEPRISDTNRNIFITMERDRPDLWLDFTNRFLT